MQGQLELGKEYPPAGEEAVIQEIERINLVMLERDYPESNRPARRDAHPKQHGCVKAEFIVEDNLPTELQVGVFQPGRVYPAWARFSNGARKMEDDTKGDTRGLGIKLLGVEGEKVLESAQDAQTQDFTFVNHPVFGVRTAQDYLELFQLLTDGGNYLRFFLPGFNPLKWRLHEFKIVMTINRKKIPNPLEIQYWSMVPYRFGNQAVKYSIKPQSTGAIAPKPPSENYLREVMVEHLAKQDAYFDFMVQVQVDPEKMPIEDPTILWNESLSPFRKVATLKIPAQTFDTPEQNEFGEHLSFSPWHSLPEHQPLGGVNRVRKRVYDAIAQARHQMNDVPYTEPTGTDQTITG